MVNFKQRQIKVDIHWNVEQLCLLAFFSIVVSSNLTYCLKNKQECTVLSDCKTEGEAESF